MNHKGLRIGELAKLFQIRTSTLRFWEDEGLVHSRRETSSGYRLYSLKSYFEVCEVSFFRNMGIPVKRLAGISTMSCDELLELLSTTERSIDAEIVSLSDVKQRIEEQKRLIGEVDQVRARQFTISVPDIAKVITDPLFETEAFNQPIQDFNRCSLYITTHKKPRYALVVPEEYVGANVIWKRNTNRRYMECLLEASFDNPAENNLKSIRKGAAKLGYKAGALIGRYLASTFNKKRYEYYHAWVEVDKNEL